MLISHLKCLAFLVLNHPLLQANWNDYCVSYLFSHRDYNEGVLGLAYIKGLCNRFDGTNTRNTGIVTTKNAGRTVPSMTSVIVFIHELGHNFGSQVCLGAFSVF